MSTLLFYLVVVFTNIDPYVDPLSGKIRTGSITECAQLVNEVVQTEKEKGGHDGYYLTSAECRAKEVEQ